MNRLNALLLVLVLLMGGCKSKSEAASTKRAAQEATVSSSELASYLDWELEVRAAMTEVMAQPQDSQMANMKQNQERVAQITVREPFKGTEKASAIRAVMEAFYVSGAFFRDEKELTRLRGRYGAALIDSIADQEALFRQKLS